MKALKLHQSVSKAKNRKLCTKSAQLTHMKENQDNLIDALSCATLVILGISFQTVISNLALLRI